MMVRAFGVAVVFVIALFGADRLALSQSTDASLAALYEAAKREGKVVMYADNSVELTQRWAEAFKRRYPGIEFDFFRGDSTQVIQRLESEAAAGRHTADVFTSTLRWTANLIAKGLLAEYQSVAAQSYPAGLQPTHRMFYNYAINPITIAFNSKLVRAEDVPKSFADLLDPKWKGKIGAQDPKSGGGGMHTWIMTYHLVHGEAPWHDYMEKLGKQIGRYGAYFPVQEALASGEVALQIAAYSDFIEPLKLKGAPVEWIVPDYVILLGFTVQVSKHAPRPNAAKLMLEFILSPEGQDILASDGKIPIDPARRPGAYGRLNNAKLVEANYAAIYEKRPKTWFDEQIKKYFPAPQ